MIPRVYYFDFFVGRPDQSPSSWDLFTWKVFGLSYEQAYNTIISCGFAPESVMRLKSYIVVKKTGNTVVQYREVGFKDYGARS